MSTKMKKIVFLFLAIVLLVLMSAMLFDNTNQYQLQEYPINRDKIRLPINKVECGENLTENLQQKQSEEYEYSKVYPELLKCNNNYNVWNKALPKEPDYDYSQVAPIKLQEERITRAVLVYYPFEQTDNFKPEFLWFYRSWIEMQKTEPTTWRTDIIIFIEDKKNFFEEKGFFFSKLNCTFNNKRQSNVDKPMCILRKYIPIAQRKNVYKKISFKTPEDRNEYLLREINIFNTTSNDLSMFYDLLKDKLSSYGYSDSILMAFDGYEFFRNSGYNFVIRSDMDVFLTPLFSKWLPHYCNDFYAGRGGYSTDFNVNRLARIAHGLKLKSAKEWNLGSTWYSTPEQFRLVSYLTLFGMLHLSSEV
jgi:hypothetical protein